MLHSRVKSERTVEDPEPVIQPSLSPPQIRASLPTKEVKDGKCSLVTIMVVLFSIYFFISITPRSRDSSSNTSFDSSTITHQPTEPSSFLSFSKALVSSFSEKTMSYFGFWSPQSVSDQNLLGRLIIRNQTLFQQQRSEIQKKSNNAGFFREIENQQQPNLNRINFEVLDQQEVTRELKIYFHSYQTFPNLGIGKKTWKTPNYLGTRIEKENCPFVRCAYSSNEVSLSTADLVVFSGLKDERNDWERKSILLPRKFPFQRWVQIDINSKSVHSFNDFPIWQKYMDIDVNYELTSSVPGTFVCDWANNSLEISLKSPPDPPSHQRRGLVATLISNCYEGGSYLRTKYIEELMKYIKVDSFGSCLNTAPKPNWEFEFDNSLDGNGMKQKNKIELFSKYKFVLAFESSSEMDFVSEKIWIAFLSGAVPIYFGAPNIEQFLPIVPMNRSIILANHYTPKQLAEYLNKLDQDDNLYNQYFSWRKENFTSSFYLHYHQCLFRSVDCRLCQYLSASTPYLGPTPIHVVKQTPHFPLSVSEEMLPKPDTTQHWMIPKPVPYVDDKRYPTKDFGVLFNGKNTFIEVSNDHWKNVIKDSFTISLWFNLNVTYGEYFDGRLVDKNYAGTFRGFNFDILSVNSQLYARFCLEPGCWMSKRHFIPQSWYHLVVTKNSTHICFYIDSIQDKCHEVPHTIIRDNDLPLRIGASATGGSFFKGTINDVSIWDVSLPKEVIWRLLYYVLEGSEYGLVGYYRFDQQPSKGEKTPIIQMLDSSIFRRHGQLFDGELTHINGLPMNV